MSAKGSSGEGVDDEPAVGRDLTLELAPSPAGVAGEEAHAAEAAFEVVGALARIDEAEAGGDAQAPAFDGYIVAGGHGEDGGGGDGAAAEEERRFNGVALPLGEVAGDGLAVYGVVEDEAERAFLVVRAEETTVRQKLGSSMLGVATRRRPEWKSGMVRP